MTELLAVSYALPANIAFGVIATVMIVAAVRVVTTDNVVHAALYLTVVLAGVAAIFILLGAEFVGVTQVLVYIGAVVVLFLFGIMLTRAVRGADDSVAHERRGMAVLVSLILAVVMGFALIDSFEDVQIERAEPSTTAEVADSIFADYIIPFEAVSVLLLAALIGAIVLARRQ